MLKIGDKAPEFILKNSEGKDIKLSDFRGNKLLMVFYPKDDSLVCTKQLCEYSNGLSEFENLNIKVIAISTDSVESHRKFKEKWHFDFEILSDDSKTASREYDALNILGMSKRAIYILDENGIIKYKDTVLPVFYKKKDDLIKIISETFNK
jgi:thioredoxin-dependent peroxiredoxin